MVYLTGDIHGTPSGIVRFSKKIKLTKDDVIIILGDAGLNFYQNDKDEEAKKTIERAKATIFCIHGNHEIRPANISSYKTKEWNGGEVWFEENHPNILFAKDGEIYIIDGVRYLVIGGAYSVDKSWRVRQGYGWWEDEQPSEEVKAYVESQIKSNHIDVVLSHTCPKKYVPIEKFLPSIDQSTVDNTTEEWLDTIEEQVDYKAWFCGHWHTDKKIDKMHFLYHSFEIIDDGALKR